MGKKSWFSPFQKQCFVSAGVCLNLGSHGFIVGFSAILLPQLRRPDSLIPIDDSQGSWIASILGFALLAGTLIVPIIMAKLGRRTANLVSMLPNLIGWFCVLLATSVPTLLIARFLQGVSMGMGSTLGPVLIGEYTSPHNRGAFLTLISVCIASGVFSVHTMGLFLTWQTTALVCAIICFVDLVIILYSPESPSFLADQGRYEECKRVFRWLRGDVEEEELHEMIEASVMVREAKMAAGVNESFINKVRSGLAYCGSTIRKKEFYKPIFIMLHIYAIGQWSGVNILSAYTVNVFHNIVGTDVNIALMVITLSAQRVISSTCAVLIIKKVKRRTMLMATGTLNMCAMLTIAAYTYSKSHGLLPFDHPIIGVLLIHVHMFSIATGSIPLPFIIAGELFPLEYRSLAGGISVLFMSTFLFMNVKTVPFAFNTLGIYGSYFVYAGIIAYCLLIAWKFLPETKDRTLREIEAEFRGRPLSPEELKSMESLTSYKLYNRDRRCSSIVAL